MYIQRGHEILTFFTELSGPSMLTLTHSSSALPVSVAVGHLALVMSDIALLPLPASLTVTPSTSIVTMATAQNWTEASGAILPWPLSITLTLSPNTSSMSSTVVKTLSTTCVVTWDQPKLQLCVPIIVETNVPSALCQLGRHWSCIRAVSSALTMNILHPVMFCYTWMLHSPSKDCKGSTSLNECDVELLDCSSANWNFG